MFADLQHGTELHSSGRQLCAVIHESMGQFGISVTITAIFHNTASLAEYASAQNLLKLYRYGCIEPNVNPTLISYYFGMGFIYT